MSRRRRPPLWPRIALLAAALVVAALLIALIERLFVGLSGGLSRGGEGRDPQFAQPAEQVTRPPEPETPVSAEALETDPSLGWVYENETPVDKTAEQLSREEAARPLPDFRPPFCIS